MTLQRILGAQLGMHSAGLFISQAGQQKKPRGVTGTCRIPGKCSCSDTMCTGRHGLGQKHYFEKPSIREWNRGGPFRARH